MKKIYLMGVFVCANVFSQTGIGLKDPNPSSVLEVKSNNKGILVPRVSLTSTTDVNTITPNNVNSLLVFNTTDNLSIKPGYYYWYQNKWLRLVNDDDLRNSTNLESGNVTTITGDGSDSDPYIVNVNVENGLSINSNKVKLGGNLTGVTEIGTSVNNTLAISGLQAGMNTPLTNANGSGYSQNSDYIVVVDSNGVLKKVKSAIPKFFYAPSIYIPTHNIDSNTNVATAYVNGAPEIDLYQVYLNQFGGSNTATFIAGNPTSKLPTLQRTDLDFFITWFDTDVFSDVTLSSDGKLNYKVLVNVVPTSKTFINVVFKVKE